MSDKRTVTNLSRLQGKVYVYLKDDRTGEAFLKAAEAEGFTFPDGAKPTDRHYAGVMAVNGDGTVNYVGAAGMAAFASGAERLGDRPLIRVDFAEYSSGSENDGKNMKSYMGFTSC